MSSFAQRPSASPTLLVGVGGVGGRLVRFLGERLANTFLARTGMLAVLDDADPQAVRDGIRRMTAQRAVLEAEVQGDVRAPFERYLRLQLIAVGNVAEMADLLPNPLFAIAESFLKHPHPPEGLRLGFVIDASGKDEVANVAPGLRSLLDSLENLAHMASFGRQGPSATVILAHRALLDGTHLDHPNLDDPTAIEPDMFEREVARLLEAMLRPGEEVAWETEANRALRYLFVGGGSSVFPRELLLGSTAKLIGADVLERTREPLDSQEEPQELLESRGDLLGRAVGKLKSPSATLEPRVRVAAEPTFFERVFEGVPPSLPARGIGIRAAAALGSLNGAAPAELAERFEADSAKIRADFEAALVPALNRAGPGLANEILAGVRERIDAMVAGELGGVDRALRSIEAAQDAILWSLTPQERACFAKVEPRVVPVGVPGALTPSYLERTTEEFPEDTPGLLERFKKAVRHLPNPAAIVMRGLLVGAVISPILVAVAASPLTAWIAMGGSVLGFGAVWVRQRAKVERMRSELLLRLEDGLGKLVYERTHELLGVGADKNDNPRLGILPQIWRYLEDWEKPLVRGFDGLRDSGIDLMRRIDEWPDGFLVGVDWLDREDPWLLHGERRYDEPGAVRAATMLLGERRMFLGWRCPSFPTIESLLATTGRGQRLAEFESMRLGDFFAFLSGLYDPKESKLTNANRVVARLELLALRCLPLGRNVAEREEEGQRRLHLAVPESLEWLDCASLVQGSSRQAPDRIPSSSAFQRRIGWLFAGEQISVDEHEADHATALGLFPAFDAAMAAEWLGSPSPDVIPSAPAPSGAASLTARTALLIGMAKYKEKELPKPVENTKDLAEALREIGFGVQTLFDATVDEMREAIDRFAADLTEDTLAFFCFNGHGCEVDGANLLSAVKGGSYNLDELFGRLAAAKATTMIVLDCCRSTFENGSGSSLKRIPAPPNTVVAYATSESASAYDDIYTPELAKYVREPNLRIEDVFIKTRNAVVKKSAGKQLPWEEMCLNRVVILNPKAAPK